MSKPQSKPQSKPPPKLEELVDFPTVFIFRAVGRAEEDLPARCSAAILTTLERPPDTVDTRDSKAGAYVSVRLGVQVTEPGEVYAVYAALRAVHGVHLVL